MFIEMKEKDLLDAIREANDMYRNGAPIMSDKEFDDLVQRLFETNPDNEWFRKSVQDQTPISRKEKLPLPMYSLEKIKSYEEFLRWVKSVCLDSNDNLVITPKYDGISLCVNEITNHALTRGDGEVGQCCDHHFKHVKGNQGRKMCPEGYYSFGEIIFSKKDFLRIKDETEYKSARNAAAGIINSDEVSPYSSALSYVRYGCNEENKNKKRQLEDLNTYINTSVKAEFTVLQVASLIQNKETFKTTMQTLFDKMTNEYKCDGLVIDIDDWKKRNELGRLPNNNPRYAIAYKDPDWSEREETVVESVKWQISKDGRLAPVIIVSPIDLCGATITKCTAYNARYVKDNNIVRGANVVICRSGDVIPKHLKTLSYNIKENPLPGRCPSCGKPLFWDENKVDIVCENITCPDILLAECVHFFSVLDFKEFREPTIKKLFYEGYRDPIDMIRITQNDLSEIEGLGPVAAKVLSRQFEELKKKGTNLAKLLTALNLFSGKIAEKTCQKILDSLKLYTKKDVDKYLEQIEDAEYIIEEPIEGVGSSTKSVFVLGMLLWKTLDLKDIPITYYGLEEKSFDGQMTIVFTGFRNKDWEHQLTSKGHKIGSSVSKKTTCVVVKEKGNGTTKEMKAESLGVPIFTAEEFKNKFL